MPVPCPIWLRADPVILLILWSAGFAVAKIAVACARLLTVLALVLAMQVLVAMVSRKPAAPAAPAAPQAPQG